MKQEINCKVKEEKPLTLDEAMAHAEERVNNLPDATSKFSGTEKTPKARLKITASTGMRCPRWNDSPIGCDSLMQDGKCREIRFPTFPPEHDECVYRLD